MRIIYNESIISKIVKAKAEAEYEGKEIEKIILTDSEWIEAKRYRGYHFVDGTKKFDKICDIPFEVEGRGLFCKPDGV